MVGKRHHIVPHFHLSRFANSVDQLAVRNRLDGRLSIRSASDMAVTDFYTFVNHAGQPDSSVETLYGVIEGATASVLRRHIDAIAFARPRAFTSEERRPLDAYVAAQLTRGMRPRRVVELLADYQTRLSTGSQLSPEDIDGLEFVPHQNEHIQISSAIVDKVAADLGQRPVRLLFFDRPLLFIGDEPVVQLFPENPSNTDAPSGGLANANGLALPISPAALLLYGERGDQSSAKPRNMSGGDAELMAQAINQMQVAAAMDWVAASPSMASSFQRMDWPPPTSILRVSDGGSAAGNHLNNAPHRRPHRFSSKGRNM